MEKAPEDMTPDEFLQIPKTRGTITVAFGRFNPPTVGHQQLMDVAAAAAKLMRMVNI